MGARDAVVEIERLERAAPPGFDRTIQATPYYLRRTAEIGLPATTWAEFRKTLFHQRYFFHEYCHLLQGSTTTDGIRYLTAIIQVYMRYMDAFIGRTPSDLRLSEAIGEERSFLQFYREFEDVTALASGAWITPVSADATEFAIGWARCTALPRSGEVDRVHVVRRFKGENVALPLLELVLAEGQAEMYSLYFLGHYSSMTSLIGSESETKHLKYTTLPGIVRHYLPDWPWAETTYFLADAALMTFRPDVAFAHLLEALRQIKSVPSSKADWLGVREQMGWPIDFAAEGVKKLRVGMATIREIVEKANPSRQSEAFLYRLSHANRMLDLRAEDPLGFFPWGADPQAYFDQVTATVPVAILRLKDCVQGVGKAAPEELHPHQTFAVLGHLLHLSTGDSQGVRCPFNHFVPAASETPDVDEAGDGPPSDDTAKSADKPVEMCGFDKEFACLQEPWARGPVATSSAGEVLCAYGGIAASIGLDKAKYEPIASESDQ